MKGEGVVIARLPLFYLLPDGHILGAPCCGTKEPTQGEPSQTTLRGSWDLE